MANSARHVLSTQVFVCLLCCEELKYFVIFCALIFVYLARADWLFNMKLFLLKAVKVVCV